jgi:hypothetical protein
LRADEFRGTSVLQDALTNGVAKVDFGRRAIGVLHEVVKAVIGPFKVIVLENALEVAGEVCARGAQKTARRVVRPLLPSFSCVDARHVVLESGASELRCEALAGRPITIVSGQG